MFRITLKNYRCFSDSQPAVIDLDGGFTAFIGTNNSGKSSYLRFFQEFRNFFQQLQGNIVPRSISFTLLHVEDWLEIFHNQNQRGITIEIACTNSLPGWVDHLSITLDRTKNGHAFVEVWVRLESGIVDRVDSHQSLSQFVYKGRIVTGRAEEFNKLVNVIANSFYVGPFRNAISEGSGSYYDISIGTTFISQWDQWKTGISRQQNESVQKITNDIEHIFDFSRLEINASPDKKAIQLIINGKPYRLRELGAGLAQFIIVFGNVATRRPALLLIDEPELNLHPSLQIDFLTSLASYASYGVMFASHSVGLARAISDRIFTFQKIKGS
ncbi:MAG TPA: AAA family ATPase, partial [Pseudomonadales bacterium]|nr:AAA family ATPase [Pseudomonadales bacterium]